MCAISCLQRAARDDEIGHLAKVMSGVLALVEFSGSPRKWRCSDFLIAGKTSMKFIYLFIFSYERSQRSGLAEASNKRPKMLPEVPQSDTGTHPVYQ